MDRSAPQVLWERTFNRLSLLEHSVLSCRIWGDQVSLRSKMRPKNLVELTKVSGRLYSFNKGSAESSGLSCSRCLYTGEQYSVDQ